MKSIKSSLVIAAVFIFILPIIALIQYAITPHYLVVAKPDSGQLYYVHNKSHIDTGIPDIVDICSLGDKTLFVIANSGTIYSFPPSGHHWKVPIRLEWCAVRRYDQALFVGSDEGVYKFPGPFRQSWRLKPGATRVDWRIDNTFQERKESFRYFLNRADRIVYLDGNGFLVEKVLGDSRYFTHQWVGHGARGITWI